MINLESTNFRAIKAIVKNVDGIYELLSAYKLKMETAPESAYFVGGKWEFPTLDKFTEAVSSRLESISDKVFILLGGQPVESHEENKEVLDVDDNSKTK